MVKQRYCLVIEEPQLLQQKILVEKLNKMSSRRFHVKMNLKLEAVTCPGVWICSHGYLEVTIKLLGYFFRTGAMEPFFPLLCHDHFKIEGYFKNAQSLSQLQNSLSTENLEITLWQNSRRLAYYEGVLLDLIQHTEPTLQCPHKNTRQLLMKTTSAFPGIIAPKIEITSEFFIKDKILNFCNTYKDLRTCTKILKKSLFNAKLTDGIKPMQYQKPCMVQTANSEDQTGTPPKIQKQKAVCHTRDFRNATKKPLNESIYAKQTGRRVSIGSSFSLDNTHTSVGICDLEYDSQEEKFLDNHEQFCKLCRLYKEVFLQ